MSHKRPARKRKAERPAVPLFREATPAGYVLVAAHLRRAPPKRKTAKRKRRT